MGRVYYAPEEISEESLQKHIVFLAGSIEMNKAEDWQKILGEKLSELDITVLNPRRPNWDSSWEQSIDNPHFNEQVNWELDGIEMADTVVFYFDPNTKSPITLLELGMVSQMTMDFYKNLIICCPDGFWRKGNVDIVIDRIKKHLLSDLNGFDYSEEKNNEFLNGTLCVTKNLNELIESSVNFLIKKTE